MQARHPLGSPESFNEYWAAKPNAPALTQNQLELVHACLGLVAAQDSRLDHIVKAPLGPGKTVAMLLFSFYCYEVLGMSVEVLTLSRRAAQTYLAKQQKWAPRSNDTHASFSARQYIKSGLRGAGGDLIIVDSYELLRDRQVLELEVLAPLVACGSHVLRVSCGHSIGKGCNGSTWNCTCTGMKLRNFETGEIVTIGDKLDALLSS